MLKIEFSLNHISNNPNSSSLLLGLSIPNNTSSLTAEGFNESDQNNIYNIHSFIVSNFYLKSLISNMK